eukprot:3617252-Amphidinium_carterae.1
MDGIRHHPQLGPFRVYTKNELTEETLEYITYIEGDTPDDERRRQHIHYLDDDVERRTGHQQDARDPERDQRERERH